jgi:hypothetical protein
LDHRSAESFGGTAELSDWLPGGATVNNAEAFLLFPKSLKNITKRVERVCTGILG